jgi:uncharacterized membrane protein YhaH (DUF805 family)
MNSVNWQFLFLQANGRIGQKDFWIAFLILFVVGIVGNALGPLGPLIQLALIYPGVCITSKRLHDAGRTGWLAAVPYGILALVTVLGFFAGSAAVVGATAGDAAALGAALGFAGLMASVGLLGILVCLAFLLWVGLSKSDPAPNQYGAPTPSMFGGTAPTTPAT